MMLRPMEVMGVDMKKSISALAFLICILIATNSLFAWGGLSWKPFSPKGAQFSVLMPGTPTYKQKVDDTIVGHIGEHTWSWKNSTLTLTAEYSDLPTLATMFGSSKTIYKKSSEGFLKSTDGKEISFKDTTVKGYKGKLLTYKTPTRSGRVLFLLIKKRLFVMQASSTKGESDKKEMEKYISSFKPSGTTAPHKKTKHMGRYHWSH
jgi:hypothetical protein